MLGEISTEDLWRLFGEYEDLVHGNGGSSERSLANATMANAIARIIVSREETSTYNMFRSRGKPLK